MDEICEADGGSYLALYKENFERPLIEATKAFYAGESDRLFSEGSFFEFTNYVSEARRVTTNNINACTDIG